MWRVAQEYLESRLGDVEAREQMLARVGMGLPQANDFSVLLAQAMFAGAPSPIPTTTELWAPRQRPSSMGETRMRQRKLG